MSFEPINVREVIPHPSPIRKVNETHHQNPDKQNKKFMLELKKEEEKNKEKESENDSNQADKEESSSSNPDETMEAQKDKTSAEESSENMSHDPERGNIIDVVI